MKVIIFDNLVDTEFKFKFLIILTLEICCCIFLLCLECLGGEWLLGYGQTNVFEPAFSLFHNNLISLPLWDTCVAILDCVACGMFLHKW